MNNIGNRQTLESHLDCFKKNLPSDVLIEFKEVEFDSQWTGHIANEGLFNMWLKLKASCGTCYYFIFKKFEAIFYCSIK